MDLGSAIGILLGWLLIVGSIIVGGGAGFLNIPAMALTIGGSFAATVMQFPIPKIRATMAVVRKAFMGQEEDRAAIINTISELAVRARRDGMLALEETVEQMEEEFMRKGFRMAIDGSPVESIRNMLEEDMDAMRERHMVGQGIFKALGNYAPAFGMIGTLIGLVQMLRNLTDAAAIGSGMATALITTLYGSLVANIIALPIAGKLEQRSNEEMAVRRMIMEGVVAIQEGNSPRVVKEKLAGYMPPEERAQVMETE